MKKLFLFLGMMVVMPAVAASVNYSELEPKYGTMCYYNFDSEEPYDTGCGSDVLKALKPGEWSVMFLDKQEDTVDIIGTSWCSDVYNDEKPYDPAKYQSKIATDYSGGKPSGQYCYCKMGTPDASQWMFFYGFADTKECTNNCAQYCADAMSKDAGAYSAMFATISSGGGSSGSGDDFSYLLEMENQAKNCWLSPKGDVESNGCPESVVKQLDSPGEWAGTLFDKSGNYTVINGIAMIMGELKNPPSVGDVPDATTQAEIDTEYAKLTPKSNPGGEYCFCKTNAPGESSWVLAATKKDGVDYFDECTEFCSEQIMGKFPGGGGTPADIVFPAMVNTMKSGSGGGGETPSVSFDYLYEMFGGGGYCLVNPKLQFEDYGCPNGTDEVITRPGQWATVWGNKITGDETTITGTAVVYTGVIQPKSSPEVGFIPDSTVQTALTNTYNAIGTGTDREGDYCFCRADSPGESQWVLLASGDFYFSECTSQCARAMNKFDPDSSDGPGTILGNAIISTMSAPGGGAGGMSPIPTSRNYVDNILGGLQDVFTSFGNNTLMLYATADGRLDKQSIQTTLGNSTSSTAVPTRGAVLTGLNTKQDAISGTANYAVTYGSTAGTFTSTPIYSAYVRPSTALLDAAKVNSAVINAVNNEMVPVQNVGYAIKQSNYFVDMDGGNGRICYRGFNGTAYANWCDSKTNTWLGDNNNKSGKWGVSFSWGDASGISVCSAEIGSAYTVATSAQATTLDAEYAAQAGNGNLTTGQTICWCKLENIDNMWGIGSTTNWVFWGSAGSASETCSNSCAAFCAGRTGSNGIANNPRFRAAVFGSYAR